MAITGKLTDAGINYPRLSREKTNNRRTLFPSMDGVRPRQFRSKVDEGLVRLDEGLVLLDGRFLRRLMDEVCMFI